MKISRTLSALMLIVIAAWCGLPQGMCAEPENAANADTFYVAPAADFLITADQGAAGLDAGDTVTWNAGQPNEQRGLLFAAHAFTTVQSALNAARADAVIVIAKGVYAENLNSAAAHVTLRGAGVESVLSGPDASGLRLNARDITLEELALTVAGGTLNITAETFTNHAQLSASGPAGGRIFINAATITTSGTLSADGLEGAGGQIKLVAEQLLRTKGATITASGRTTGGDIRLLAQGTAIFDRASRIAARGGSGNGGFVEVSGDKHVYPKGSVDTRSTGGRMGTFLIDPQVLTVQDAAGTLDADPAVTGDNQVNYADGGAADSISVGAIETLSVATHVVLEATSEILLTNTLSIDLAAGSNLTLQTDASTGTGDIKISGGGNGGINATGGGTLTISAPIGGLVDLTGYALTTAGGNVSITSTGALTLGSINAGAGNIILNSVGAVTQAGGSALIAGGLKLANTGPFTLTEAANNVVNIATVNTVGTVSYRDTNDLNVATVDTTVGITTLNPSVTLQVGGNLLIDQAINLGAGDLTLNVTGTTTQNAGDTITAGGIQILSTGATTLTLANVIGVVAANANGAIALTVTGILLVDAIGVTTGITTSNDAVTLTSTGGSITTSAAINAGSATVILTAATNIISSGAITDVTAGSATLDAVGTIGITASDPVVTNVTGTLTIISDVGTGAAVTVDNSAAGALASLVLTLVDTDVDVSVVTFGANSILIDAATREITGASGGTNVRLNATAGALTVGAGALSVGTGELILNTASTITQNGTGVITAARLLLLGSGDKTLSAAANAVTELAGNVTGAVDFNDPTGFSITSISGTNGLAATTDITLNSTAAITQTAGNNITAAGLRLLGTGAATFTNAGNALTNLASSRNGTLSYTDTNGIDVTTVGGTVGINSSNNLVTLVASGANGIALTQGINSGTANLVLTAGAGMLQGASGAITANQLILSGSGAFALNTAVSNITDIAVSINGALSYSDSNGFTVVNATYNGINTTNGNVNLSTAAGTITINTPIAAGAGTVTISGAVTQIAAGIITGAGLELLGAGGATLTAPNNNVARIAANHNGAVNYRDFDVIALGTTTGATTGITLTNSAFTCTTPGAITVSELVNTGAGDVTLSAGSGVTQTAAGVITANTLILTGTGAGAFVLNTATSNVSNLAASINGALSYAEANGVNVVNSTHNGIATTGNNVTLTTAIGAIAVNTPINATGATVSISGAVTQLAAGIITANGLELLGIGGALLNVASNNVAQLAANRNGTISYLDADAIALGTLTGGTTGIVTTK